VRTPERAVLLRAFSAGSWNGFDIGFRDARFPSVELLPDIGGLRLETMVLFYRGLESRRQFIDGAGEAAVCG
jgi:hypothetical protein